MRVKQILSIKKIDRIINEFITEDIIVVDIKYMQNGNSTMAFIHYYTKTDVRILKLEKLLKKQESGF